MTSSEFKEMVIPHYRAMYGVALAVLGGDSRMAEDAVQDTLLRLWDNRKQLPEITSCKAYAIRAVRNRCLELLRSSTPKANVEDESTKIAVDTASIPDQRVAAEAADNLELASRLMAKLPEAQRNILHMRAFSDLDNEEIAHVLGINNATVRQQLSRARKALREMMGRYATR